MYQRRNSLQEMFLCFIDGICVVLSFLLAGIVRFHGLKFFTTSTDLMPSMAIVLLSHIAAFYCIKLYKDISRRGLYREFIKVFEYNIILLVTMTAVIFSVKNSMDLSRLTVGYTFIFNNILVYACHYVFKSYMMHVHRKSENCSKIVVITSSDRAEKVLEKINAPVDWNYVITALAITDKEMKGESIQGFPVIAGKEDMLDVIRQSPVDEVVIHLDRTDKTYLQHLILELEQMGLVVHLAIDVVDLGNSTDSKRIYKLGNCNVVAFASRLFDYRLLTIKRCIDLAGAIVGLCITAVVTIFLAPAILIESPGPLFFKQKRVGKNGRIFEFYKFRSMYRDAEERKKELMKQNEMKGNMFKMKDDPRITKVGKFIRKTSLDELPQFWNVLKGDMSLVGTRPPTLDEYYQYESHHKRRLSITPGITGLWQISGRSDITDFDEVVKLDLEYIDHWSLGLDIKILFKTIAIVFRGSGAR